MTQLDLVDAVHQVGWVRLPHDTAAGGKAGDWVPAYRCCLCGWGEINRYWFEVHHDCCNPGRFNRSCDDRERWPERMAALGSSWVAERPERAP